MQVSSVSANAAMALSVPIAGAMADPEARKAAVNAQADLLHTVQGGDLPLKMVAARVTDGKGVDLYM